MRIQMRWAIFAMLLASACSSGSVGDRRASALTAGDKEDRADELTGPKVPPMYVTSPDGTQCIADNEIIAEGAIDSEAEAPSAEKLEELGRACCSAIALSDIIAAPAAAEGATQERAQVRVRCGHADTATTCTKPGVVAANGLKRPEAEDLKKTTVCCPGGTADITEAVGGTPAEANGPSESANASTPRDAAAPNPLYAVYCRAEQSEPSESASAH